MPEINKKSGFTLVELLVVIAIIAILSTILLPTVDRAKKIAKRAGCLSNLKSTAVALRMYLNDSNDIMPKASQYPSLNLNSDPPIADVLAEYMDSPKMLKCPADQPGNYYDYDRDNDELIPVNRSQSYYETEMSSYEYHSLLGGKTVDESFLTQRLGQDNTPVMNDYKAFHGYPGKKGAMNYLFADSHVGDLE